MNLSEIFIRRPIMTVLVMMGVLILGLGSYRMLPVSDLPNVDFPSIQVTANLPGASPETMAASVATPLEQQFSSIAGITSMNSTSNLGSTQITLQFDLSRSIDGAAQDVQSAISAATRKLPTTMPAPPSYRKVNPADQPILYLSLNSSVLPLSEVNKYAETQLAQRISTIDGVAQVNVFGAQKYAVRALIDPQSLSAKGIGIDEVADAIAKGNSNLPTGNLFGKQQNVTISTNGQLNNAADYSSLIVAYRNGSPVQLGELGQVIDSVENDKLASWFNGNRAIVLAVQKQPGTNTVETVERIRKILPAFRKQIPAAVNMEVLFDRSQPIKESIDDVQLTLLLTIFLVVLVIFLFLRNLSATIIPSLAVPLSLIATFGIMLLLGYSLDNLSLMALTLSVGFVVDDAVVMLENIVRYMEMGERPFRAALKASQEIGFTILSMTISLVAVFIPILFMGGILGRLFKEFAVTISVAILCSGAIAISLTPMLCSRFLRVEAKDREEAYQLVPVTAGEVGQEHINATNSSDPVRDSEGNEVLPPPPKSSPSFLARLYNFSESLFNGMQNGYAWSLKKAFKHHRITSTLSAAILVGTIVLFVVVPKGFIPNTDIGYLTVTTQAAPDISFESMVKHQQAIVDMIRKDENVAATNSTVGAGGLNSSANAGRVFISLKPRNQRSLSADEIVQELRPKLSRVPGVKVFLQNPPAINIGGQQTKAQYQYTLQSTSFEELQKYAPALEAELRKLPELQDVNTDLQINNPQVYIQINREQAASFGLTATQIETALGYAYGTRQVSTIYAPDSQYQVILGVETAYQQDRSGLDLLSVRSSNGQLVPLNAVAAIARSVGPLTVTHSGQLSSVTLSFNLKPGISLGDVTGKIAEVARQTLPDNISTGFQGSAQAFQDSLQGLGLLLLAAIFIIYIVLGILYEDFIHPLTILSSLPSAGFGALLTLLIFHVDLNIYSFIGIILLIGIVKKNGIMMIDFAIAARNDGKSPVDAIYEACLVRFRPIMMTTMAALMGTLPIALGLGAGADARRPLGLVVVGGLLFSQFLTLYLTPVFYTNMESLKRRFNKRRVAVAD
ncbi:efflux RND transporter permease subunit [Pseudanabaena sp. PCC 6802]|uniref:efflux RND transporter permease subunit n=1 Tax=Pseudanabaena sp. PCC 6802 TaxID=118173 RepID=UPI00034ABAC5|nr:efflux RND transporter permease subunit [Pseudanabaena sp. PCC 6802]